VDNVRSPDNFITRKRATGNNLGGRRKGEKTQVGLSNMGAVREIGDGNGLGGGDMRK